jgi:hypothetical protein
MLKRRRTDPANFVAEYDDGSEEAFGADPKRVIFGEHIATLIALELQDEGRLKLGNIVRTYRPFCTAR